MPNRKTSRTKKKPTLGKASAKRAKKKSIEPSARKPAQSSPAAAALDSERLKDLYSRMLKCRLLGEKLHEYFTAQGEQKEMAPGREAILVGAASHAQPEDSIFVAQNRVLAEFAR